MPKIMKSGIEYSGGGGDNSRTLTYEQYEALTESEKTNGTTYYITDANPVSAGSSVEIDTTLTVEGKAADAKAVGDAIAELRALFESINIKYVNFIKFNRRGD